MRFIKGIANLVGRTVVYGAVAWWGYLGGGAFTGIAFALWPKLASRWHEAPWVWFITSRDDRALALCAAVGAAGAAAHAAVRRIMAGRRRGAGAPAAAPPDRGPARVHVRIGCCCEELDAGQIFGIAAGCSVMEEFGVVVEVAPDEAAQVIGLASEGGKSMCSRSDSRSGLHERPTDRIMGDGTGRPRYGRIRESGR